MVSKKTKKDTSEEKPQKNYAVEFWRFLFTIAISFGHFNSFGWIATGKAQAADLPMMGGRLLGLFLFLSGYFMMASYQRKKKSGANKNVSASHQAWSYTKKRWMSLYPALLGGVTFAFIVRNILAKTPLAKIPILLAGNMFEFFGLSQLGLVGYNEIKTTAELSKFISGGGVSTLWNGPLWYISAMLIVSVILYYILSKNEDFFVGFFCPIIIIGAYGFAQLNQQADFLRTTTGWLGIPNNLLRVAAGMCVGCLIYFVVEYFKKKDFSEAEKWLFTILHGLLAVFFVYTFWKGLFWSEFANNAFIIPFTIVLLVNKDYISKFLNQKICGFLGRLSLYYYCNHIVFVFLLPELFPTLPYGSMAVVFVIWCFLWSLLMMIIDDYIITPLVRKKLA